MRMKAQEVTTAPTPLLWNPPTRLMIADLVDKKRSGDGVLVVVAPPGSGKSTYLRSIVNEKIAKEKDFHVALFGSELRSCDQFFERFGDAKRKNDLFDHLPSSALIVMDQVEDVTLNDDVKYLIKHAAIESRRTGGCSIVVSTSSIDVARSILSLNGNDKIKQWGKAKDFQWSDDIVDECVAKSCDNWSQASKDKLREYGRIARSPAFMRNAVSFRDEHEWRKLAGKFARDWKSFAEVDL